MDNNKLIMRFDPKTVEHLGISLYSKLPTVLGELISNSWDADADNVELQFNDNNDKEIIYSDDGEGMNFKELNDKFLLIGRNRRSNDSDITNKKRKVIGKKGLGKLSVFGICKVVEITSIKNGIKNKFEMDIDDIINDSSGFYSPKIIELNQSTDENSGTKIILKKIKRKSNFNIYELAVNLSKKFLIFDQIKVMLKHNDNEITTITNELKFQGFKPEFRWTFPNQEFKFDYEFEEEISGEIISLETPIKDPEMKGIYLTSRGKIVNLASYYGLRDNDQFHEYVSGYLEVDFIDNFNEDVISTDRQSLNWEHDKTQELQKYLQLVIKRIEKQWRDGRAKKKAERIKEDTGNDVEEWQSKLPTYEQDLSRNIINPVLTDSNLSTEESSKIIGGVMKKFENEDFKQYASHIADIGSPQEIPKLLLLMEDWKVIETKQFSDLARTRIEVIKQFEQYIDTDAKEVPTLHNFLKKFSWLLDPRILEFKDEVKYSKILKETFPESKLQEKDKRIDFLCSNAMGGILYVVEIKRGAYKVDTKALEQAYEYGVFLKHNYATQNSFSKVVCYVVGGSKSNDSVFQSKLETYQNSGEVFIRTYSELLEQAKEYHKEFIEQYNNSND